MPVKKEEVENVRLKDGQLHLSSYGLPLIFWAYLIIIYMVSFFMFLAVRWPLQKMISQPDPVNRAIAYCVYGLLALTPFIFTLFYFYKKKFVKKDKDLFVIHKVFGLAFFQKRITLSQKDAFEVRHFLSSPNMARIHKNPSTTGFENKGYFELFAQDQKNNLLKIDRASRKVDLEKLKDLLSAH